MIFQPVKVQRKMRNFHNELFDSVEAHRNSAVAERHFYSKLKRKVTFGIEISTHNKNAAFFAILDGKIIS